MPIAGRHFRRFPTLWAGFGHSAEKYAHSWPSKKWPAMGRFWAGFGQIRGGGRDRLGADLRAFWGNHGLLGVSFGNGEG